MAEPTYTITSRAQTNRYDPKTQKVAAGWEFVVEWKPTGTELTVFVPGEPPTPEAVDAAIRELGAVDDKFGKLGG